MYKDDIDSKALVYHLRKTAQVAGPLAEKEQPCAPGGRRKRRSRWSTGYKANEGPASRRRHTLVGGPMLSGGGGDEDEDAGLLSADAAVAALRREPMPAREK